MLPFLLLRFATTAFSLSAAAPRFCLPLAAIDGIVTPYRSVRVGG